MTDFWRSVIDAGGDEPTEASRRTRRRMMIKAKMHDPRDGGPYEERFQTLIEGAGDPANPRS